MKIAVLGGGISGLSTCYFLSKLNSVSRIFLIEPKTPGGWISSIKNDLGVFETGPRTLRPAGNPGASTLDLIHSLNLENQMIVVPKNHPAALNRYIYKGSLQVLPSNLFKFLFNKPPIMNGFITAILKEPFVESSKKEDESIYDFISRRFSSEIADNLVSAIIHGIYAGDIRQLSIKSTMPFLKDLELKHGSIIKGLLLSSLPFNKKPLGNDFNQESLSIGSQELIKKVQSDGSIYSFKNGMATLSNSLLNEILRNPKVSFIKEECTNLNFSERNQVKIQTNNQSLNCDKVISALPSLALGNLLQNNYKELSNLLLSIPFVTVAVVNLSFPASTKLPIQGFGYLVPNSQPSKILGVIFDSDTLPEHSRDHSTRLTVMMGGYKFRQLFGDPTQVSSEQLLQIALEALESNLKIQSKPISSIVNVHRDCIPQYVVGHSKNLKLIQGNILNNPDLNNRLFLVGASYKGVGINDCIYSGRRLVEKLKDSNLTNASLTGLE